MAKKGFKLLEYLSYSPDLAPCNFFYIPPTKKEQKNLAGFTEQELMTAVQGSLKRLLRNGLYQVFESRTKIWIFIGFL